MNALLRSLALAFLSVLTLWLSAIGAANAARAEDRRIALVIGNNAYQNLPALTNPRNDARLIRQTLESLGFEVIYREDIGREAMQRVIAAYNKRLAEAGPTGVGLFYYAGHGIQSGGENFLIPVDSLLERETDLRVSGIKVSDLLTGMAGAGIGTKIVILDACRDNPFVGKQGRIGSAAGLADIGLGSNEFFLAYAATVGNVADDGGTENSPYALALARRLATRNSEISNTFRLVRVDVSAATHQSQLPETRTTLRREFYFSGSAPANQQPDRITAVEAPAVRMLTPVPSDLLGRWCTASRGGGTSFEITNNELRYILGPQSSVFGIQEIALLADGKLKMVWNDRRGLVEFEFGQFSANGQMMTQLRGRQGTDSEWHDYNLRLRKCG